jgi:murein DD-endopeptidase MepM/ murein hydrolase activator NlpD
VTAAAGRLLLLVLVSILHGLAWPGVPAAASVRVSWEPAHPRAGDVVLMRVRGVPADAIVEATLDGHPVTLFSSADGYAGVVGIDMDTPAGARRWHVTLREAGAIATVDGELPIVPRAYTVQHLTVAQTMVELDPATERRAVEESERLRLTYRAISGERLWHGAWVRPVAGEAPGTGFGARRVINGQPRSPHGGTDYAAPRGTPVVAANDGRVALVADFFFPGRLVVLDHGLGLYTLYFHLEDIAVAQGDRVTRGQTIGSVGATGRATGPHLHFGAQVGPARVDPATLLGLPVRD